LKVNAEVLKTPGVNEGKPPKENDSGV